MSIQNNTVAADTNTNVATPTHTQVEQGIKKDFDTAFAKVTAVVQKLKAENAALKADKDALMTAAQVHNYKETELHTQIGRLERENERLKAMIPNIEIAATIEEYQVAITALYGAYADIAEPLFSLDSPEAAVLTHNLVGSMLISSTTLLGNEYAPNSFSEVSSHRMRVLQTILNLRAVNERYPFTIRNAKEQIAKALEALA